MKTQIKLIVIAAVGLPLLGCDTSKKLTHMHDSTVRMDKTTQDMNQSTAKMNNTMDGMAGTMNEMSGTTKTMSVSTQQMQTKMEEMTKTTEELSKKTQDMTDKMETLLALNSELYQVAKHGSSMELRRNSLKAVHDSKQLSKKIAEAMKYYMAFEFQIWMNQGEDNAEKREFLQWMATQELLAEAAEFVTDNTVSANPISVADKEDNLSFVALGVGLEAIDQRQLTYLKLNKDLKPVTMLSMFEEALQMKATEKLPMWAYEIKNNEAMALRLLNARMNGYALMFLGRAGALQFSSGRKITIVLLNKNIKVNLKNLNDSTLSEFIRYLKEATRTRTLLKSLGRSNSSFDEKIVKMLLDMQIEGGLGRVSAETKDTLVIQRAALELDFRQTTQDILK